VCLIVNLSVLHPYSALPVFTGWWQIYPFAGINVTNPSRYLSDRVSLVKPSPLRFTALQ